MEFSEENIQEYLQEAIERGNRIIVDYQQPYPIRVAVQQIQLLSAIENGDIEPNDEIVKKLADFNIGYFAFSEAAHYDQSFMLMLCHLDHHVRFNLLNQPLFL